MKKQRSIDADWRVSQDQPTYGVPNSTPLEVQFWATDHDILRLMEGSGVRAVWNFNTALGETIRERYESLYTKLVEIRNILVQRGVEGYFWMATSPEISSIFETSNSGFTFNPQSYGPPPFDHQWIFGAPKLTDVGTVHNAFRLFKSDLLPKDQILMGADNYERQPHDYAVLTITNLIV